MLRVGLTGGLGAGKSAVGVVWAEAGVHVLSADEMGRRLMQPGQAVFAAIVERFGPGVVAPNGTLDRRALSVEAFERGRLEELNALVHPAVLSAQEKELATLAEEDPGGVAAVESALIFEVNRGDAARGWSRRFDKLVLVAAPEQDKIARYVARAGPAGPEERARREADARARLRAQLPDSEKAPWCDFVIENTGSLVQLRRRALAVLSQLRQARGD